MLGVKKNDCCGCRACEYVCSHEALRMAPDGMGFLYPQIDIERCVGCGACVKACSFMGKEIERGEEFRQRAYAVKHKDEGEIGRSQSGGAFAALSGSVLARGGVIYGVGYGEGFYVCHQRAATAAARDEFRGSKYVQSDMSGVYEGILRDLNGGRCVLFTGTPCQTAAVRKIFGRKWGDRLLLVDLICHGVASPAVWRDYISYLERKERDKIVAVNFRDKKFGWHSHRESFTFKGGKTIYPRFLVYKSLFFRPSCGGCKYSSLQRSGDITIGDYWGVEEVFPDFETENRGCSLVICNTPAGAALFESISWMVDWREVENLGKILQPNLVDGTRLPDNHEAFTCCYARRGFRKAMAEYDFLGWKVELRRFLHKVKRKVKSVINQNS